MSAGDISVKGFIETSFLDWPGKVAAVVFLPGCNFRCPFCHNAELVENSGIFEDIPVEAVLDGLRENAGWIDGVVITGGEPTVSPWLMYILRLLKEEGLPVKLDTNGSRPDVLGELIGKRLVCSVAMDIKTRLDEHAYRRAAGVRADVEAIRRSIRLLAGSNVEAVFRTTVVPGLHDHYDLQAVKRELFGLPLTLQNFRPANTLDPSYRNVRPFPDEVFEAVKRVVDSDEISL